MATVSEFSTTQAIKSTFVGTLEAEAVLTEGEDSLREE
jgi:hypothetical protein